MKKEKTIRCLKCVKISVDTKNRIVKCTEPPKHQIKVKNDQTILEVVEKLFKKCPLQSSKNSITNIQ
jgi:hypothetical protein